VTRIVCVVSGKVPEYVNVSRLLVLYVTATSEFHFNGNIRQRKDKILVPIFLRETIWCHCQMVGCHSCIVFGISLVPILTWRFTILTELFRGSPKSL
jgi:hypothetical protein